MRPERGRLVRALHHVRALAHQRRAGLRVAAADLDAHRVALVACLASALIRAGIVAENSTVWRSTGVACRIDVDVVGEAHVEHLVGLVEDHRADRAEMQRAAADVVERPARRGDDDVHAAIERLQLAVDRLAAVDRRDLHAEPAAVLEDGLADLHRQLAGRARG